MFTLRYVTCFIICYLSTRKLVCFVLQLIQHYGTCIILCSFNIISCSK